MTRQRLRRSFNRLLPFIVCSLLVACGGAPTLPTAPTAEATVAPSASPTDAPTATFVPTATVAPSSTPEPTATSTPEPTATSTPEPTPEPTATSVPAAQRTMPRGSLVARPWTIMIDNHPDAVPQTGLNQAVMVFEGLAEFGITRFMATYVAGTPLEQVGPIRSTRLYFAQLAMGMHPIYGHAGGSPDGEELVRTTSELINFDADGSQFAYRDTGRAAPHNLYTNSEQLTRLAESFPLDAAGLADVGYTYDATVPAGQPAATIDYFFEDRGSRASWSWDGGCACYRRSQRDRVHTDRLTGEQITTTNLVVMEITGGRRAGDAKSRIDQYVVGGGKARIFRDGLVFDASWTKESEAVPLRFVDAQGTEIAFAPGAIWIAGVPTFDRVTVR